MVGLNVYMSGKKLKPSTKKYLRSLAHHLDPVVIIGQNGVTDGVIHKVRNGLESHELIKIRFNEYKREKKTLTEVIARETGSEIVGSIGHIVILYRQQTDEKRRKIRLP